MSDWDADRGRMEWPAPDTPISEWAFRPLNFDRQGNPITTEEWGRLRMDGDYAHLGDDYLIVGDEPIRVSTVWLGIDHSVYGQPPIIFETMTFGHGEHAELQERYATEEAALAGHERIVAYLLDHGARR